MAWITISSAGDGIGVDETPDQVIEIFESATGDWVKLHDRGRSTYIDARAVYTVCPDNEEIAKEVTMQLAAEAAEREGKEVAS